MDERTEVGAVAGSWPPGAGEMARLIRAHDWAATPLGPAEAWPERLKGAVEEMLASPHLGSLACGPGRVLLYNDAAAKLYDDRHPGALGRPLPETWPDAYAGVAPLYERAFAGETVHEPAWPVDVSRAGGEVFDVALTPVRDGTGAVMAVRMTGFEMGARARTEAALRESEERYRSLFEAMRQGYVEHEIVRDGEGQAVAHRVLDANPQFERLTGIPLARALGRTSQEFVPGLEPYWLEMFDRIVRSGEPERIEHEVATLGRWYEVYAYPRGGDRFAILYDDVTERRRAEIALRASEERQAFLLRLSDALRPLADPVAIMAEASEMLGRHLGVGRCAYGEIDATGQFVTVDRDYHIASLPSVAGRYRIEDYGTKVLETLQRGQTFLLEDVLLAPHLSDAETQGRYAAMRVRAAVVVPLVKSERQVAHLSLQQDSPRAWAPSEIRLIEDVAERTWAAVERARAEAALRVSEERFRSFAEASTDVLWIVDAETGRLEYLSPAFERVWGTPRDAIVADLSAWADSVLPEDRPGSGQGLEAALAGRSTILEYRIGRPDGEVRHIRDTGFPIWASDGRVRRAAGIAQDLTDQRRAERALVAGERRLRGLVEGIPQLVWSAVEDGQWTWASPQWMAFTGLDDAESRGRGWLRALHPDDRAGALDAWAAAEADGGFDVEYRLRRVRDGQHRWFATRATPVRDDAGRIVEWLGTSTDVDDLRRLEAQGRVLVAELQHRTRNLVGVVRSIADRTARGSRSLEEFQARFDDRMAALARVQGLLARRDVGRRVTIEEVIRTELAGLSLLDGDRSAPRVMLDGPEDVRLRDAGVQTFALALHELATNALKHGALSRPGGRLRVSWGVGPADGGEAPGLTVTWQETGAKVRPPPDGPERRGYGRELIERALPFQLGARTEWELGPDGLRCVIVIPHADAPMEKSA